MKRIRTGKATQKQAEKAPNCELNSSSSIKKITNIDPEKSYYLITIDDRVLKFKVIENEVKIENDSDNLIFTSLDVIIEKIKKDLAINKFEFYLPANTNLNIIDKYSDYSFHINMLCDSLAINSQLESNQSFIIALKQLTDELYPFFTESFNTEIENNAKKWLDDFVSIPKEKTILIYKETEIISALLSFSINENYEYIFLLGTDNNYRRKGYGKKLLAELVTKYPNKKFVLGVTYNTNAYKLYNELGFKITKINTLSYDSNIF